MKLRCLEAGGGDSYILLESSTDKDNTTEKQEELKFHNFDGTTKTVVVEKNLRVVDLCQILIVKNRVNKDYYWSVVESWSSEGFERVYEDHEDILALHRRTQPHGKLYHFRHEASKYDLFDFPECIFPADMRIFMQSSCPTLNHRELLHHLIWNGEETPVIFSQANYLTPHNKKTWIKKFFVLKGTRLYMTADASLVRKFLRFFRNQLVKDYEYLTQEPEAEPDNSKVEAGCSKKMESLSLDSSNLWPVGISDNMKEPLLSAFASTESLCESHVPSVEYLLKKKDESGTRKGQEGEGEEMEDWSAMELFADLADYELYQSIEPVPEGVQSALCLRPLTKDNFSGSLYFGTADKKDQQCWLSAMRLAKYGRQLRENYKSFKGKQDAISQREYQTDSTRSRVAMDFTGNIGRIVEDPQEAKEIEMSEGIIWKKRWKERNAHPQRRHANAAKEDQVTLLNQPWYHEHMSRDQAVTFLNSLPDKDGVFVVRDSKSKPGCFVLTSKHNGKIIHTTVEPFQALKDEEGAEIAYSADGGATRFIDLYQLIWFYILNPTSLPTKLLHWTKH